MSPQFLGNLLRNRRSDPALSVWELLGSDGVLAVTSASFEDGGVIPSTFAGTGVGGNVSPALAWTGVPAGTGHLAVILEDVDVPFVRPLLHTMAILAPDVVSLAEGGIKPGGDIQLVRGMFGSGYRGPRPIVGHGPHHYRFMVFAVDADVDTTSQSAAIASMLGHVIARGRIVGTYER